MTRRVFPLSLIVFALMLSAVHAQQDTGQKMTQAAEAFLKSLDDKQRAQATMPFQDEQRTDWHYIPKAERKGLTLNEMTEPQREMALALLQAALSEDGYKKATTIMALEHILRKVEGNPDRRDPLKYYWTLFGEPKDTGRWGLSVEGHHLSLNFTVADGKLASPTPLFFGANPNIVKKDYGVGPGKGTYPLGPEEQLAFDLLKSLDAEQRKQAIVADKSANDMSEATKAQTDIGPPVGLPVSKMNQQQKDYVLEIAAKYITNVPQDVAKPYLGQLREQIEQGHFAWYGATEEGKPHSYRLQTPGLLFLLYNTQADTDKNPANHSHTVWRTIGKDFYLGQR